VLPEVYYGGRDERSSTAVRIKWLLEPAETTSSMSRCPSAATIVGLLGVLLALGSVSIAASENARHPLDPLTAAEYRTVVEVLGKGYVDENGRFALITLEEPEKSEVLRWKAGAPISRRAFAIVKKGRSTFEAVIDLFRGRVDSWQEIVGVQPGVLLTEEWTAAQEIVRLHPGWQEAVRKRGIDSLEEVVPVPLTAGHFGSPEEETDRLVKVVAFDGRGTDNFWGRPIEGLIAVVSHDQGKVIELIDSGAVPIPKGPVDLDESSVGELRVPPNLVSIDQPEGPSYELDGHLVRWQKWSFHWRIDPRLGLVISLVRYDDKGKKRSVLYQASLSELFVPYTDPDVGWYFRAFMDAGEYGVGKLLGPLEPGLDCPSYATFFHPRFVDEWGNSYVQGWAACLFERYAGDVAWRHHEAVTGRSEARRRTELVIRSVPAVGNYDYVFDWVFRQDGSIGISVGATGVPAVKAVASRTLSDERSSQETAYGHMVAEHSVAINHDHFFCFRLDLDVDGRENSFLAERLKTVELEGKGPRKTSWVVEARVAPSEQSARLRIDLEKPALWRVINPKVRGPLGYPVSYQLAPRANAVPLLGADDFPQRRAGFTDFHLWLTPYSPHERYAAGTYPNQSRGGDGLPSWTSRDRPIRNTDIVLWYTLGLHHVVRAEDWPVMPTTWSGFEIKPFDFFRANPALDLPKSP
jgi:primary-amine oxidase